MSGTLSKGRRALIVLGVFAIATVIFVLGIHWDLDQVALPTALLVSLGVALSFPIYTCAECKHAWIRIGGRDKPCPKCNLHNIAGPGTFWRLLTARKRLAAEI